MTKVLLYSSLALLVILVASYLGYLFIFQRATPTVDSPNNFVRIFNRQNQTNSSLPKIEIFNEHSSYSLAINPLFNQSYIFNSFPFLEEKNINKINIYLTNTIQKEQYNVMFEEQKVFVNLSSYDYQIDGNEITIYIQVNPDLYSHHYTNNVKAGEVEITLYKALAKADVDMNSNLDEKIKLETVNQTAKETFSRSFGEQTTFLFLIEET